MCSINHGPIRGVLWSRWERREEPGSRDQRLMSHPALSSKGVRRWSSALLALHSVSRSRIMILIGVCWGWTDSESQSADSSLPSETFAFVSEVGSSLSSCGEVDLYGSLRWAGEGTTGSQFTAAQRRWIIRLWLKTMQSVHASLSYQIFVCKGLQSDWKHLALYLAFNVPVVLFSSALLWLCPFWLSIHFKRK